MVLLAVLSLAARTQAEELRFSDGVVVPLVPNHTHRGITGSILELKDGSLLFAYSACEDTLVSGGGGIAARKSTDGGRTWGEPYILQRTVGLGETVHPSLLRLKNGQILFAYSVHNAGGDLLTGHDDQHQYVRLSADEGKSWTDQICATLMPGVCQSYPDSLLQLSTGRIIMPVDTGYLVQDKHYVALCAYSDNGGYTWWFSKNYVEAKGSYETGEPHVAELADGRLIMLARTNTGYMARSYSKDQGETWSKAELVKDLPAAIPSPSTLVRLPSTGDLLCLWCNNPHGPALAAGEKQPTVRVGQLSPKLGEVRAPLCSTISRDGGQTWGYVRELSHDPAGMYDDYGYPCVAFLDRGKTALINYNALDGIHLARINVDWFYPLTWSVVGPFPSEVEVEHVGTGMDIAYPPEQKVNLKASYEGLGGKKIAWQVPTEQRGDYVNLFYPTGCLNDCVSYAVCYLDAPKARKAVLDFGVDYWGRVWLNGEKIFEVTEGHSFATARQFHLPVQLKKGRNELLVKVHAGAAGNAFWMNLSDPHELKVSPQ
jgi:sialidase-1